MIIEPATWEFDILRWMQPAWEHYNLVEISETTLAATDGVMLYLAQRKSEIPIGLYQPEPIGDQGIELLRMAQHIKFPDWEKYVNGQWVKGKFKTINNQGRSKKKFFHDIVSALPAGHTLDPFFYELAVADRAFGFFHAQIPMSKNDKTPVLIYPDERDRRVYIMPMRESS